MRRLRGFASILLAFSFIGVALTGMMMWIPALMPGVGKHAVEMVHLSLSILLLIATVAHIAFNWRVLIGYVCNRAQGRLVGETIVAALLTGGVAGAILLAPEPPEMQFFRLTPAQIAERCGMSKAEVVALLKEDGLSVGDGEQPMMMICRESQVSPPQIIEHIRSSHPKLLSQ